QAIQPKNELSTWSVDAGGQLQTGSTTSANINSPAVQPKNEDRKEEDDKQGVSQQNLVQKQHDSELPPIGEQGEEQVQRSVIDDALGYIGSVTDCISLDLNVAKACALRKAQEVALHIPDYRALRVVLGQDPITG